MYITSSCQSYLADRILISAGANRKIARHLFDQENHMRRREQSQEPAQLPAYIIHPLSRWNMITALMPLFYEDHKGHGEKSDL
jgi:hypothetical protein